MSDEPAKPGRKRYSSLKPTDIGDQDGDHADAVPRDEYASLRPVEPEKIETNDDLKKRLIVDLARREVLNKYIDLHTEGLVLESVLKEGIGLGLARAALTAICADHHYLLESALRARITDQLSETVSTTAGHLDEKQFGEVVTVCRTVSAGKIAEAECKKLVIEVVESSQCKVKTGFFGSWLAREKKALGMPAS